MFNLKYNFNNFIGLKMDIQTGQGSKVKFTNQNGYDMERKRAAAILSTETIYMVEAMYVEGYSSTVKLEGIDGEFNTVMFENIGEDYPKYDWFKNGGWYQGHVIGLQIPQPA